MSDPIEAFLTSLGDAPARVLLLDYDGTLAPFRSERAEASPYAGVREAVQSVLDAARTRVVVVSGRSLESLRPLLGVEPPPELWGTHGWERLERGLPPRLRPLPAAAAAALAEGARALASPELRERIEVKPASVALHIRGLPDGAAGHVLEYARTAWERLASSAGLDVHDFDGGVELRVGGWNKGDAVRAVVGEEPVGAAVAYLGDDRTDEDAFRALNDLSDRGEIAALTVLVRPERRESEARAWLRPPEQLLEFLAQWREAAG